MDKIYTIHQIDPTCLYVYDIDKFDPEKVVSSFFYAIDNNGVKVDEFIWETHCMLPSESPTNHFNSYLKWKEMGIDMMEILIRESKKRGIRSIFNHRFSEVDPYGKPANPIKLEHPDWVVPCWWPQGLWNVASEGLRQFKLDYIKGIIEKYDFDGINIDFARHTPCLPQGQEWELRHHVTEFMQGVRSLANDLGRPFTVGAKTPENGECCRLDGFDIAEWINRDLVDFLVLGSRTIEVDVAWYKSLVGDKNVMLFPCWDTWHSADARHFQKDEFFVGLFRNWLQEGADGIVGFNYSQLSYADCLKVLGIEHPYKDAAGCFEELEAGIRSAAFGNAKAMYTVDRRGGYPYCAGHSSSNFLAPLPMVVSEKAQEIEILTRGVHRNKTAKVRLLVYNAKEGADKLVILVNGVPAKVVKTDYHFIDMQIWQPHRQPISSGSGCRTDRGPSELLELFADVDISVLKDGKNTISIALEEASGNEVSVERAEIIAE